MVHFFGAKPTGRFLSFNHLLYYQPLNQYFWPNDLRGCFFLVRHVRIYPYITAHVHMYQPVNLILELILIKVVAIGRVCVVWKSATSPIKRAGNKFDISMEVYEMTSRKKIIQAVGAGALLALFAGGASAALLNSGFEDPDASGGDVAGSTDEWETFEFVYTNNTTGPGSGPVSHGDNAGTLGAGYQSLKMFGPWTTGAVSGAYQSDNSVVAGQAYEVEAWAMNWVGDPFQNLAILQLQFTDGLDGTGNVLDEINQPADTLGTPGYVDLSVAQDGADVSDWTRMAVSGIAPPGTQSAKIYLLHVQTADPCCAGGAIYWDDVSLKALSVPIQIDIKPGSDINSVNTGSMGVIAVAVLTSDDFDALQVDPETARFGPAEAAKAHSQAHVEDVDYDGDMDLVFHFRTQETGIQCGDIEATLTGETWDGIPVSGTDSVNTVSCE